MSDDYAGEIVRGLSDAKSHIDTLRRNAREAWQCDTIGLAPSPAHVDSLRRAAAELERLADDLESRQEG